MSGHRQRAYSPPRYYVDQPRNPTSSAYVTSYDTAPRGGTSSQPKTGGSITASGRHSVAYETQPIRKSTLTDGKTKTEYAVRPRNNSYAPSTDRRPLTVSTRNASPTRRTGSLAVASPREMTPTVVRDDSSRLLLPAPAHGRQHSHHQRHNSTTIADLDARDATRERRDKTYHSKSPYVERAYHMTKPSQRNVDDEGWSYTGPREQFDRDYPQRPQGRRDSATRKDRPVSHYDLERPSPRRDQPVIPLSRQLVRSDRIDPDRHVHRSEYDSDPDKTSDVPKRRHSTRHPVVHQQHREDGYPSPRDDFEGRNAPRTRNDRYDDEPRPRDRHRDTLRENDRDRDYDRRYHRDPDRERLRDYERDDRPHDVRRKPRSRESSPQRSTLKDLAAGVVGSLATAGVVKGLNRDRKDRDRDDESEDDERREPRKKSHRHRSRKDDAYSDPEATEDRRRDERRRSRAQGDSNSDTPDDQPSRRHQSRRYHDEDEPIPEDKSEPENERHERGSSKVRVREDDDEDKGDDGERRSREAVPAHKQDQAPDSLENRTISPGENEDDRPRRVQLVEPVREKDEVKPRGILKPARQVPFPEDPNPIREGVAPLKDATKDGIPPNARWTKINRLLVNPEALEKAHERFEEREDYVIVLRVLSREEIQKLADKTKEVRGRYPHVY